VGPRERGGTPVYDSPSGQLLLERRARARLSRTRPSNCGENTEVSNLSRKTESESVTMVKGESGFAGLEIERGINDHSGSKEVKEK